MFKYFRRGRNGDAAFGGRTGPNASEMAVLTNSRPAIRAWNSRGALCAGRKHHCPAWGAPRQFGGPSRDTGNNARERSRDYDERSIAGNEGDYASERDCAVERTLAGVLDQHIVI